MNVRCDMRWISAVAVSLVLVCACSAHAGSAEWAQADGAPTSGPTTRAAGPDVVVLTELVSLYEPVPFSHAAHAEMADMWNGCTTCHHRSPDPDVTRHDDLLALALPTQDNAAEIPACKSCHPVSEHDQAVNIHMPSLKGAYHRQCLNCHREWTGESGCIKCHLPLGSAGRLAAVPTPDDVVGRMHPPIPEPDVKVYTARFTPAVGRYAMFRHEEHVTEFGLSCVNCHHRDTCASCHNGNGAGGGERMLLLSPARSWRESHGPCMSCHRENRCSHCHYDEPDAPPPPFDHARTGQRLDEDHADLACSSCHAGMRLSAEPTCGGATCHVENPAIAFPAHRPGDVTHEPAPAQVAEAPPPPSPTTAPAKAIIRRVRR